MMIPLRRAFIVKQHKELPYPEGTACADVLKVGEEGGSSAKTVFAGFGLAFAYNMLMKKFGLWHGELNQQLYTGDGAGLKGGVLGAEITPELLGVGYIIGPRIASITFAGGVLAYLVLVPAIVLFGEQLTAPVFPAESRIVDGVDKGLIANMSTGDIRNFYILYIGAGAVAAGGIISMFQALPLIVASMRAGLRDIRAGRGDADQTAAVPRTERDMPMSVVLFGSLGLVLALAAIPNLGLGLRSSRVGWRGDDRGVWVLVCDGVVAVNRHDRLVVEPDLGHDRRHAAADVPGVFVDGTDRQRGNAYGADGGGGGLHRGVERRDDGAGPEDRFLGRRNAEEAAVGDSDRGADVGAGHGRDAVVAERGRAPFTRRARSICRSTSCRRNNSKS